MNISETFSGSKKSGNARHRSAGWLAALLVALVGFGGSALVGRAQPSGNDEPGAQVLTRGPVHEAFAGIVSYDAEPGIVVTKTPPEAIEEVPPEERPEGDNVAWIPGYWAWDDERSDFLWISGTWRALPPDREWMAGYWTQTPQGYQWISGYWADATANETTYLPAPPETVEAGPNVEAPSADYGWTPGCWLWIQGRYAWRPGYWTEGRADWDWIPAHYVWTPRGYIFVDGFWDYTVERRGILFAPVFFETSVYARRGYRYSPTIVISLGAFTDHLFLRPRYGHYYFGDYYAPSYQQSGIYASFSFQSGRHGYDPFYSHQRWEHRTDREWDRRIAASYQYRRDHETARPPRTWSAQIKIDSRTSEFTQNRLEVAVSIDQLAKRRDGPVRFQPVAGKERQQLVQRNQEVQKSREQRRTLEAKGENLSVPTPGVAPAPARVQQPRSPIVAKPASRLERNQAPPKMPQAPKPEANLQTKTETPSRASNPDRNKPGARPHSPELEKKSAPARNDAAPDNRAVSPAQTERTNNTAGKAGEKSRQKTQQESEQRAKNETTTQAEESQRNSWAQEQKARHESEQRKNESGLKAQQQAQQNARELEQKKTKELEQKTRQESEQRAKTEATTQAEESQRNSRAQEQKIRQESEQREKKSALKAREQAQRNGRERELEQKAAQDEAEQRAKVSAIRAQEESLRKARQAEQKTQRETVKPDKRAPGSEKKNAPKPPRKDEPAEEKKKSPPPEQVPAP